MGQSNTVVRAISHALEKESFTDLCDPTYQASHHVIMDPYKSTGSKDQRSLKIHWSLDMQKIDPKPKVLTQVNLL